MSSPSPNPIMMARGSLWKEIVQFALWSLRLIKKKLSGVEPRAEITFTKPVLISGLPPSAPKESAASIGEHPIYSIKDLTASWLTSSLVARPGKLTLPMLIWRIS